MTCSLETARKKDRVQLKSLSTAEEPHIQLPSVAAKQIIIDIDEAL